MGLLVNTFRCQFRHPIRHSSSFVRFDQYLRARRAQAEKSMLIQVSGPESTPDVHSYLTSEFGPLTAIYHYSLPGQAKRIASQESSNIKFHWVIAEFYKNSDLERAVESCRYQEGTVPFQSKMCWFSQKLTGKNKNIKSEYNSDLPICSEQLGSTLPQIDFSKAKSLDDQIRLLENSQKISELGTRVRFLVCSHLERCVKTMFPTGCILPFGSSVNGVGRFSGDLDLVLLHDKSEVLGKTPSHEKSRLWYQSKVNHGSSSNARFQSQRVMETLADVITLFIPGCSQVQRILQARVPILRFWSDYTFMQCDLSMTNASGVYMSELIYIMVCIDNRFPSLLFSVRSWAAARKITVPTPGKQPTNFMFVLLLIYFLQHKNILPTLDILFNNANKGDKRITVDGIDCTFMREAQKINKYFTPQNQNATLAELLFEFYEFYSEFDFATKGISLFTSSAWGKPDAAPLYIQNPLERHLNVSRNVSREEVARFKNECCSALWKLESSYAEDRSFKLTDLVTPEVAKPVDSGIKMKELLSDQ